MSSITLQFVNACSNDYVCKETGKGISKGIRKDMNIGMSGISCSVNEYSHWEVTEFFFPCSAFTIEAVKDDCKWNKTDDRKAISREGGGCVLLAIFSHWFMALSAWNVHRMRALIVAVIELTLEQSMMRRWMSRALMAHMQGEDLHKDIVLSVYYLPPGIENSVGGIWLVSVPRRRRHTPLKV